MRVVAVVLVLVLPRLVESGAGLKTWMGNEGAEVRGVGVEMEQMREQKRESCH